jgi:aminoglycoside 3-N-acetyltransferase
VSSQANKPILDLSDLLSCFAEVGVQRGGTVLAHSSLSSFGIVRGGEHTVIDALLEAVGPDGLVAVPTHTWSTVNAQQPVFHEQFSPSVTGRVTESFRLRPSAVRSLHPTHSVAAIGPDAQEFCGGHELRSTPCSRSSPYGRLVARRGQILMLGVELDVMTLMHGIEEWAEVPWLFNRVETLRVITSSGSVLTVLSRRHTDDPYYEERDYPSLEPLLNDAGAIRYGTAGNATIRLIDATHATDVLLPLVKENPDLVLGPRVLGPAAHSR